MARLWRARYRRAVASAFRTVPLYRELWALDGRTDPVLVPGRTGRACGAITVDEALHRLADLVPLGGGPAEVDPARGRRTVLGRSAVQHPLTVPSRTLDELAGSGDGVLHDGILGYLGRIRDCGRWHLDWRQVYARETPAGLAFTLLRQRSPRLVDVLVAGGVPGAVRLCPEHATPTVHV